MTFASKHRLPSVFHSKDFVEVGGLMSYGAEFDALYRRAAAQVDKILKGAKPADIPLEQPKQFEFVINMKAARQIGLTNPPTCWRGPTALSDKCGRPSRSRRSVCESVAEPFNSCFNRQIEPLRRRIKRLQIPVSSMVPQTVAGAA